MYNEEKLKLENRVQSMVDCYMLIKYDDFQEHAKIITDGLNKMMLNSIYRVFNREEKLTVLRPLVKSYYKKQLHYDKNMLKCPKLLSYKLRFMLVILYHLKRIGATDRFVMTQVKELNSLLDKLFECRNSKNKWSITSRLKYNLGNDKNLSTKLEYDLEEFNMFSYNISTI